MNRWPRQHLHIQETIYSSARHLHSSCCQLPATRENTISSPIREIRNKKGLTKFAPAIDTLPSCLRPIITNRRTLWRGRHSPRQRTTAAAVISEDAGCQTLRLLTSHTMDTRTTRHAAARTARTTYALYIVTCRANRLRQ